MSEINKLMSVVIAYLERGLEYAIAHVMTIEGVIALLFGIFLLSLVARIRN